MIEFLQFVNQGRGDYTTDRGRLFDHVTVQEIAHEIVKPAESSRDKGGLNEFFPEVERVAHLDKADREAWLRSLRSERGALPEAILTLLDRYMRLARKQRRAGLEIAQSEELLEARASFTLEALLSNSRELPDDPVQALRLVAKIAIAGHLFPHLRRRLEQTDAQEFLLEHLTL
jgi:hypothetical protein